ncbi:MAG: hypothetical protein CME36_15405 [unclassified Hahellaceae]|nr:hypothetical protein [Hahellaceae bacterium]
MDSTANTEREHLQAHPRFSLVRAHPALFQLLSEHERLIVHSPQGSGKRRGVLQWLATRNLPYRYFKWRRDGSARKMSAELLEKLPSAPAKVLEATRASCTPRSSAALILDLGPLGLDMLVWSEVAALCLDAEADQRIIVLTAFYPEAARLESRCASGFMREFAYYFAFNDLAMTPAEVCVLHELLPADCRAQHTSEQLFTLTKGWPGLVSDLLVRSSERLLTPVSHGEERLRTTVYDWLARNGMRFEIGEQELMWLLLWLGPLPHALFTDEEGLKDFDQALQNLQVSGLLARRLTNEQTLQLNSKPLVELVLSTYAVTLPKATLTRCRGWLERKGFQSMAIEACLRLEDWSKLETLLLANADELTARLHVYDLRRWINLLDEACEIRHPILLICAVRCAIYQGSDLEIMRYFQRVLELLRHSKPETLGKYMNEERMGRFIAEIQLYSELTQQGVMTCQEWVQGTSRCAPTNPVVLLQEAFSLAQAGDMAKLFPVVATGLAQTEAMMSWALHLTFSIFNFWMLILSCRRRQAEQSLQALRARLVDSGVSLASAYDWLDMLELLLERMAGKLQPLGKRAELFQGQPRIAQDILKNNLLVTLRADLLLLRGDIYSARQVIHELASLQSSATSRSYWFASAVTMHDALQIMAGSETHDLIRLPPTEGIELDGCSLQEQTALLWRIKMRLHQLPAETLFPLLDRVQGHLMRTGQWLRTLEVDVLRAVCLYRSRREEQALSLFMRVAGQLETESLLGVLADPFLLWRIFPEEALEPTLRHSLSQLLDQIAGRASATIAPTPQTGLAEALTTRETQVLILLSRGLKNQGIADELKLSVTTVRTHVQHIYRKLKVSNRAAATACACRMQLV